MKNIKRLFSLVMALAMIASCMVVASAAEVEDVPKVVLSTNENLSISANENCNQAIEMGVTDYAYVCEGIIPLANNYYVQTTGRNKPNGSSYNDSFSLSRDGKLITHLVVIGKATIKVQVKNGLFWGTLLNETVTNSEITKISVDSFPSGTQVKVEVRFQADSSDFALEMWSQA